MSGLARGCLAVAGILTLVGFVVTLAGVGSLQWKANDLNIAGAYAADPEGTAPTIKAYTETFTTSLYTPYPLHQGYQFGFAWWLLMGELAIWVLTMFLVIMPKFVHSVKLVILAWLASFMFLTWSHINTLLFLSRNEIAMTVFGSSRIIATLVGLLFVAVGNGLTITVLGLWPQDNDVVQPAVTAAPRTVKSVDTVEQKV